MSKKGENGQETQEKEYEVETILDRKISKDDCYYYHVKWMGYSQTTWEPLTNLLGGQDVQRMIAEFQKALEKKNKKNWSKGLAGWANLSKSTAKNNQNINKDNLDTTFYKENQPEIVDLQKLTDYHNSNKKPIDDNPFIGGRVKKKVTTLQVQRYPFEHVKEIPKRPCFMRKVSEIKKVQMRQGQSRCLVKWKAPQNNEQWISTDMIRVMVPEMLANAYEKAYQQK